MIRFAFSPSTAGGASPPTSLSTPITGVARVPRSRVSPHLRRWRALESKSGSVTRGSHSRAPSQSRGGRSPPPRSQTRSPPSVSIRAIELRRPLGVADPIYEPGSCRRSDFIHKSIINRLCYLQGAKGPQKGPQKHSKTP